MSQKFKQLCRERYSKFFGENSFEKVLDAQKNHLRNEFIRINTSKTSKKKVEDFLKKNRVKYSQTFLPYAIKIDKSFFNLSSSISSLSGEIYLQDLASQIPVNCIDFSKFKKKARILDMCASPGSKTTQICDICESLNLDYEIVALEPNEKRLTRLYNNLQKQGFKNVQVLNQKGEEFSSEETFNIIFLDVPCSGNIVGDRDWLSKRNLKGIKEKAELQKKLLENASKLVKKEGLIIYSTCSLEVEENEENILWAVNNFNLKTQNISLKFPFETKSSQLIKSLDVKEYCHRLMPYLSKTQGFFVCVLRKN